MRRLGFERRGKRVLAVRVKRHSSVVEEDLIAPLVSRDKQPSPVRLGAHFDARSTVYEVRSSQDFR